MAFATQNAYIFSGTLSHNLYYGLMHQPLRPPPYDDAQAQREQMRVRDALAAGNSPDDVRADWIDYATAGVADAGALAEAAAGMPPGRYTLAGQTVELDRTGRVAAPGAPNLAGSALTLPVAIGNTVRFSGLALEDVIPMATTRPAEYIGIRTAGTLTAEWDAGATTLRVVSVTP